MRSLQVFIVVPLFFISIQLAAQDTCALSSLGQNPQTAFPVCGTQTFNQAIVPACGGIVIPVPAPCHGDGYGYSDLNPYWYKFTCFQSGTLQFLITPNDHKDDYDWQLFDVTGHDVRDVYKDISLFVVGNWAGTITAPSTGASPAGKHVIECFSDPHGSVSTYSIVPNIIQGHNYLLLVSHYTQTGQSGYSLTFGGGTAVITDTLKPLLQTAETDCGGSVLRIKTNKKMKCSSLAADGSDFKIADGLATPVAAKAVNCGTGFDMDSIILTLDKALPAGVHYLVAANGSDANTLLDYCDQNIASGDSIPFTVLPFTPTIFDSITPVACAPKTLQLVFKRAIRCSTIAANGSDFEVSGGFGVTVTGAGAACTDGLSKIITVQLAAPISKNGLYRIVLKTGTDGNTLVDECGFPVAQDTLYFRGYDTVSADFYYTLYKGCTVDSVAYFHDGSNNVNKWLWTFDNNLTRTTQNTIIRYSNFGVKQTSLTVSNSVCTNTITKSILLDNYFNAAFEAPEYICPSDLATFKNNSTGNIIAWQWYFGNGDTSTDAEPAPQIYPVPPRDGFVTAKLIAISNLLCFDTAYATIKLLSNCSILVPTAFTPNGDGLNDYLYPLNAYNATNLLFRVYNRLGQLVFETKSFTRKWDGTFASKPQPAGTYVWSLSYTNSETGKAVSQKGTSVLIR